MSQPGANNIIAMSSDSPRTAAERDSKLWLHQHLLVIHGAAFHAHDESQSSLIRRHEEAHRAASSAASGDALEGMHDGDHECRRCGLTFPVGPPLPDGLDVERLREAHRLAQVMDGDYMQNVATVYARLQQPDSREGPE